MYEKGRSVYYQICEQSNRRQRAGVCGTGFFLCDAFFFSVYDAACHDRIEAVRYEHKCTWLYSACRTERTGILCGVYCG